MSLQGIISKPVPGNLFYESLPPHHKITMTPQEPNTNLNKSENLQNNYLTV